MAGLAAGLGAGMGLGGVIADAMRGTTGGSGAPGGAVPPTRLAVPVAPADTTAAGTATKYCTECGTQLPAAAKFCSSCGTAQS